MQKILLIEDNKFIAENTALLLNFAQYEVTKACNGKEGVYLAQKEKPDLIICDIMMPEMNGYDVFHTLKNDSETASIPFIFLSARTSETEIFRAKAMGVNDYITKPFYEEILLKAVKNQLK